MKVTILGTGSAYSKSNCTGILIDDDLMLDIGPGTVKQLIKGDHDLSKIQTLFISHLHLDHILDFPMLICNLAIGGHYHPIQIYGPAATRGMLQGLIKLLGFDDGLPNYVKQYCHFNTIKDGQKITATHHLIEIHQVEHDAKPAFGFNIDGALAFTGDSAICNSVKSLAANSQVLICDCSLLEGNQKHMGINDLDRLATLNPNLNIIPVHYRDETREVLRTANPHHFSIIDDGHIFSV